MYDDFDLDYTYDYSSSLDEDYTDRYIIDENDEHARESTNFQELAYMHYAWCISTRFAATVNQTTRSHYRGKVGFRF